MAEVKNLNERLVGKIKLLIMNPEFVLSSSKDGFKLANNEGRVILDLRKEFGENVLRMYNVGDFDYEIPKLFYTEPDNNTAHLSNSPITQITVAFEKRYREDQNKKAADKKNKRETTEKETNLAMEKYLDSLLKQNG